MRQHTFQQFIFIYMFFLCNINIHDFFSSCYVLQYLLQNDNFATNGTHSELMNQLVGARARGARAVVLWTNPENTEKLMQALGQEIAHGSLRREDLFWLIASPDGQAPHILRKFGNVLGGALVFR